jgi:hypothetical protein
MWSYAVAAHAKLILRQLDCSNRFEQNRIMQMTRVVVSQSVTTELEGVVLRIACIIAAESNMALWQYVRSNGTIITASRW